MEDKSAEIWKELYSSAIKAFECDNYEIANKDLSKIIEITDKTSTKEKFYILRAATALELRKYHSVLEDCNFALSLNPRLPLAFYLKGKALYETKEIDAARKAFQKGEDCEKSTLQKKKKESAKNCDGGDYENEEYKLILKNGKHTFFWDDLIKMCDRFDQQNQTVDTEKTQPLKIRNDWSQSNEIVFVTFYCKNLSKEFFKSNFFNDSFSVQINHPGDCPPYIFTANKLFAEIIPEESKCTISPMKIEVLLKKKEAGVHWISLENKGENLSFSKKKKDWDKINKDCEEMFNKEKPEGEDALNDLFRKIYANSDENTRRAMIKSFQTSNGTVLSTNWNEVKSKDYEKEIQPPKGQEVHKWET